MPLTCRHFTPVHQSCACVARRDLDGVPVKTQYQVLMVFHSVQLLRIKGEEE